MPFSGRKESLFDIIKHNKKIIPINIHSKYFQENIESEFLNSQSKLNKLNETGILNEINQLVYELYGLSTEDITLIENSLNDE